MQLQPDAADAVLAPLQAVATRAGEAGLAARVADMRAFLGDELQHLEAALAAVTAAAPLPGGERTRAAAQDLLGLTGKRIRPLCVLLTARMGGRPPDATVRAVAVACELVHAATLLHDDVIDDADVRRGAAAARVTHGNAVSVLAGDYLLMQALQRVLDTREGALLAELFAVLKRMVAAEALQLERRGRFVPDRALYLDVIRGKTAALFAWGLQAGGSLAALAPAHIAALGRVGTHLGMAFQLTDDVLDLTGDPRQTGKAALCDVREGKLTWPLILAAEADAGLAAALAEIATGAGQPLSPQRAAALMASLGECGALDATRSFAAAQATAAQAEIDTLPEGAAQAALRLVVDLAVARLR